MTALTSQQQEILRQLEEADRHRIDLLALTENDYQLLRQALDPLIRQGLVYSRFEEDMAQRFCLTSQGRRAIASFSQ